MEAEDIIKRYQALKSEKSTFDVLYQEIGDYCLPNSADFNRLYSPGEKRNRHIYDQTAQHAIDISSSSLIGLVANPAARWFHAELVEEELNRDTEIATWLDRAGQIALNYINDPESGFYSALKPALEETLAFGVPAMMVQETPDGKLDYKHKALHRLVLAEGANGIIDTVIDSYEMTNRQLQQKADMPEAFAWDLHPDVKNSEKEDEKIEVLHLIAPRKGGRSDAIDRKVLPVGGWIVDKKHRTLMYETGYYEMPLPVARWKKTSNEVYGRSPAMTALSDIKTLNEAQRMFIAAMGKRIRPTIFLPHDTSMNKVTLGEGEVVFYNPQDGGRPFFEDGGSDVASAAEYIRYLQNQVRNMFYVDQLQLNTEADMTATEVMQRQDEKARLLAPSIGRLQTEFLSPIVLRTINILIRNGTIPPMPSKIAGKEMNVTYVSPLNRAQRSMDAQNILQTASTIAELAKFEPSIKDKMDLDKAADELFDTSGTTGVLKRDDEDVKKIREQRQQMQQAQMALEAGQQMSQIKKNNE